MCRWMRHMGSCQLWNLCMPASQYLTLWLVNSWICAQECIFFSPNLTFWFWLCDFTINYNFVPAIYSEIVHARLSMFYMVIGQYNWGIFHQNVHCGGGGSGSSPLNWNPKSCGGGGGIDAPPLFNGMSLNIDLCTGVFFPDFVFWL